MALRPQTQTYIPTGSTAPTTEVAGAYTLCYQHAPVPLTETQTETGAIQVQVQGVRRTTGTDY